MEKLLFDISETGWQDGRERRGNSSEERIETIQNHEEIRPGTQPIVSGAMPAEKAVFLSDFEFQVYLARNSSD
jgi:hypothetical protein